VGEGEPDITTLGSGEITLRRSTARRRIASEVEEVITGSAVGSLAEGELEELLS
jgi:hypothetical protein